MLDVSEHQHSRINLRRTNILASLDIITRADKIKIPSHELLNGGV